MSKHFFFLGAPVSANFLFFAAIVTAFLLGISLTMWILVLRRRI